MSLSEQLRLSQLRARVRCPNCKTGMVVQTVSPALVAEGFLEITYACHSCKGETKRWVKTDDD